MIFDVTPPIVSMPSESGRHVEQQHLAIAGDEDVGLHRGAERDHLVGVQLAVRRPAEQLARPAANQRNARRSADAAPLRRSATPASPASASAWRHGAECPLDDRRRSALRASARVKTLPVQASVSSRSEQIDLRLITALRILDGL